MPLLKQLVNIELANFFWTPKNGESQLRSSSNVSVNSFPSLYLLFLCSNSNEKISGASHHHGTSV